MTTQMNNDEKWLRRMAEDEANCELSVGGLAHEAGLLRSAQTFAPATTTRTAFAKLIEFRRRERGLSVEELADKARIGVQELLLIEHGDERDPEPTAVVHLADVLKLPEARLMELSGLAAQSDAKLTLAAARFAARSKPNAVLTAEERNLLDEFLRALDQKLA